LGRDWSFTQFVNARESRWEHDFETFFHRSINQNNKRFQRDEFIAGKASANLKSLETSKPKTTSDFNVMNLSRGKHAPIITSIKTRMNRMNQE
jgi:hypothetical protein